MAPLGELAKRAGKLITNNSPVILTAIGVTGTLATAYLTGKAAVKASVLIRDEINDQHRVPDAKEQIQLCWKLFIPAAGTAALTVTAIIFANRIENRRAAALAAAYAISERAFEEYREKILEKLGAKKEQSARDELEQERVDKNPISKNVLIITEDRSVLCYESFTGRYFLSDMETLRRAQNDVNEMVLHDSYASLAEFYVRIGLPQTSYSDEVGWNTDNLMELQFSTVMSEDNKPCISVNYRVLPIRHYYRQ